MCQKVFLKSELNEENYNLIVSNVILSQTKEFTYNDILDKLSSILIDITENIKSLVKNCLIRLRDDGFLSVLGCNYLVIE